MSTEKQRREAAKRERTKKKRLAASAERSVRMEAERGSDRAPFSVSAHVAASWPVKDAWIGEYWHTWHSRVQAGISTEREDGRMGCAFFEVDLRDGSISDVRALGGVVEGNINAELVRRAQSAELLVTSPHNVAHLLNRALAMREPDASARAEIAVVQRFLRPFDPEANDIDPVFGERPADEVGQAAPAPGMFDQVKRWFGLG